MMFKCFVLFFLNLSFIYTFISITKKNKKKITGTMGDKKTWHVKICNGKTANRYTEVPQNRTKNYYSAIQ